MTHLQNADKMLVHLGYLRTAKKTHKQRCGLEFHAVCVCLLFRAFPGLPFHNFTAQRAGSYAERSSWSFTKQSPGRVPQIYSDRVKPHMFQNRPRFVAEMIAQLLPMANGMPSAAMPG